MIEFGAEIVGAVEVERKLTLLGDQARQNLRRQFDVIGFDLVNRTKAEKLSGGVLKVRTGRLRNSINWRVRESPDVVQGTMGTRVPYARVHELGFDGDVTVREHTRRVTVVFGREIGQPIEQTVRSYTRHLTLPKRSFLASTLAERRDAIVTRLEQALRLT